MSDPKKAQETMVSEAVERLDAETLLKRYREYNIVLEILRDSGKKRDKTVDTLRGMAWQLYHILKDLGYDVDEPAWP